MKKKLAAWLFKEVVSAFQDNETEQIKKKLDEVFDEALKELAISKKLESGINEELDIREATYKQLHGDLVAIGMQEELMQKRQAEAITKTLELFTSIITIDPLGYVYNN